VKKTIILVALSFIFYFSFSGIAHSHENSKPWNPKAGEKFCDNSGGHARVCIYFQTSLPENFSHYEDMQVDFSGVEYVRGTGMLDKFYGFHLVLEPGVYSDGPTKVKIYYSYTQDFDRQSFTFRYYADKVVLIYVFSDGRWSIVYEDKSAMRKDTGR